MMRRDLIAGALGDHAGKAVLVAALLAMQACTSGSGGSAAKPTSVDALQLASTGQSDGTLRVVDRLPAPTNVSSNGEQPLSPGDTLEVSVFQVENLSKTVQIDASGRVNLALIGAVQAGGKSVRQLEQEVETAYGASYLQNPDVTIFVKDSMGQRVTIDGEVAKAGITPVGPNATLLDVVALAGGFRPVADATKVFVYRTYGSQKLVANYNVEEIRKGKGPNPRIYGGDVVVVFPSSGKVALQNLKEALGVASSATRLAVVP